MKRPNTFIKINLAILLTYASLPAHAQNITIHTPCPNKPNCVSSHSDQAENSFIAPFTLKNKNLWEDLKKSVQTEKRTQTIKEDNNNLHVIIKSKIFKFTDDVILKRNGTKVDVRSSSRVGYSDFGVNRNRIEKLRTKLQKSNIIE